MSVNTDPETFEALRRLLALKRYEQPPPGYFDRFPSEVIARISQDESEAGVGVPEPRMPWLHRVWNALEARVLFPTIFGAAVSSILVLGLIRSLETHTLAVSSREGVPDSFYSPVSHPIALPLVERTAFEPSTAGVLPDQSPVGILRDMHGPGKQGISSAQPLLHPSFN